MNLSNQTLHYYQHHFRPLTTLKEQKFSSFLYESLLRGHSFSLVTIGLI